MWRGSWEEQALDHIRPERVPAGVEEELQPAPREPEADAGEKDSRALQTHYQAPAGEQVNGVNEASKWQKADRKANTPRSQSLSFKLSRNPLTSTSIEPPGTVCKCCAGCVL